MSRKRSKDQMKNGSDDNNTFSRSLREIPFRLLANDNEVEESFFMKKVYQDRRYSTFFLSSNCQQQFQEASKILMTSSKSQVHEVFREKEKKRNREKKPENETTITYSKVLTSSLEKSKPSEEQTKSPDELYRDYLSNISPSELSEDFKDYSTLDFDNEDNTVISEFGVYHNSLVELFLKQFTYDEKSIVDAILSGTSVLKNQPELYKKFSAAFYVENSLSSEPSSPQNNRWKSKVKKNS